VVISANFIEKIENYRMILELFLFSLFPSNSKQIIESCEIFFHYQAYTLGSQTVACKIPVVRLIVNTDSKVAIREQQIVYIKVANERRCCIVVVSVSKLSVYLQSVI